LAGILWDQKNTIIYKSKKLKKFHKLSHKEELPIFCKSVKKEPQHYLKIIKKLNIQLQWTHCKSIAVTLCIFRVLKVSLLLLKLLKSRNIYFKYTTKN